MNFTGGFDQAAAINDFAKPFVDELTIASLIIPGAAAIMAPVIINAKLASFLVEHASDIATTQLPASIKAMTFQASPTVFDSDSQLGSWQSVMLTVADSKEYDASKLALNLFDLLLINPRVAKLTGKPKDLYDFARDAALDTTKELFFEKYNALREKAKVSFKLPPIQYSTMGQVDITSFSSGYTSQVRGGSVITITSHTDRSYKPISPLKDGSANLVLQLSSGFFNNSGSVASQSITVKAEETTFAISSIEAPESVSWGAGGQVKIYWEGSKVTFPVTYREKAITCIGFSNCSDGSKVFSVKANPLVVTWYCNGPPGKVATSTSEVTLTDQKGKVTSPVMYGWTCGP